MEIEYKIISALNENKLASLVNAAISGGWLPQGGLCIAPIGKTIISYSQAMTRERRLSREEMQRRYYEEKARQGDI